MLGATSAYSPTFSLTNLSGGSNTAFKVGDSWRIDIVGAQPNACVYLNANLSMAQVPMSGQQDIALSTWLGRYATGNESCGVGTTDSSGNYTASGTFTKAQVGQWVQNWTVQGNYAGGAMFSVADESGSTQYTGPMKAQGTAYYTLDTNHPATNGAPTGYQTLADQLAGRAISTTTGQVSATPVGAGPSMNQTPGMPNLTDITHSVASGFGGSALLLIGGGLLVLLFVMKGK